MKELKDPLKNEIINSSNTCHKSLSKNLQTKLEHDGAIFIDGSLRLALTEEMAEDGTIENINHSYQFETQTGEMIPIDNSQVEISTTPLNSDLSMAFEKRDGKLVPYVESSNIELSPPVIISNDNCASSTRALKSQNITSPKEYKIGLFHFLYKGETKNQAEIDKVANDVAEYFSYMSRGKYQFSADAIQIEVSKTSDECKGTSDCDREFRSKIADYTRETSYRLKALIYNGRCGGVTYYGHNEATCYCDKIGIILHELGHANLFDMHHSTLLGETSGYGDYSSIMGGNVGLVHFNAYNMYSTKFYNPTTFKSLTKTEKLFFIPLEADESESYPGVYQIAEVKNHFIALRSNNHKYHPDSPYGGSIQFSTHNYSELKGDADIGLIKNLSPGESASFGGVKVHFIGFKGELAEVDIYYNTSDPKPVSDFSPPEPTSQCLGDNPKNASLCSGDLDNLTHDLLKQAVETCSSRKCEYKCLTGFEPDNSAEHCIQTAYQCNGAIPPNSVLCSGDNLNLTSDQTRLLVSSCTSSRKCEYICAANAKFENGKCVEVLPVIIFSSSVGVNAPDEYKFSLSDNVTWRIKNAGANARACIESDLLPPYDKYNNYGYCKDLNNFSIMANNNEWYWSEFYQVWALKGVLKDAGYWFPGKYRLNWYNPDSGQLARKIIYISQ